MRRLFLSSLTHGDLKLRAVSAAMIAAVRPCSSGSSRPQGHSSKLSISGDDTLAPPGTLPTAAAENSVMNGDAMGHAFKKSDPHSNRPQHQQQQSGGGVSYAPWEVRALVLALLPVAYPGTRPMTAVALQAQLPVAVRLHVQQHPAGLMGYIKAHFPNDVTVTQLGDALLRRTDVGPDFSGGGGTASLCNASSAGASVNENGSSSDRTTMAPPPPPVGASTAVSASSRLDSGTTNTRPRTTLEMLDAIVPFIPTFYVSSEAVAQTLPSDIQRLYADTNFVFFLKRMRHYIDIKTQHGRSDIRLRPDFNHPKRGDADAMHSNNSALMGSGGTAMRRPPRNSEANLILFVVPRIPKEFTPLSEVLQEVSELVSRHPSFDPRLGVTGFFEKYPEYFQIVDGKMRGRPYRVAPNALAEHDAATSPLPAVFEKLMAMIDGAAEGRSYAEEADRAAATVSTGKLYALLSNAERAEVKAKCRSFPRFLRLHGKAIMVSVDNMKVIKFKPEFERCADTILDQRLAMNSISPDDPILQIPESMDEKTNADWAVKELYDALPLVQCAELHDVLSLVPTSVKEALPTVPAELVQLLSGFPDYFLTWPSPDSVDEGKQKEAGDDDVVIMIQRAKVPVPQYDAAEIVRIVAPLIPQGGTTLALVMRRSPLQLQRYFHHFGIRRTLVGLKEYFLVSGERVIRIG